MSLEKVVVSMERKARTDLKTRAGLDLVTIEMGAWMA